MNLKNQSLIILIILVIILIGKVSYNYLFEISSPSQVAVAFLNNHQDYQEVKKYVSKSDELILDQVKNDYLSLTKIPKTNLEAKVAADITLSESAHKVDLQTNKGIITLNLLKEDEKWVVFLNLKQIYKISQLLEQLKDAELRENE